LELYKQGKTVHEIGAELHIARVHVREYLIAIDKIELKA
jgi:response regulator of citrate/malate metabolism